MEPYLWLILKISPVLIIIAGLFFWLGSRKEKSGVEHVIVEKDATLEREQARHDETTRKLAAAEDRLGEIQAAYQKVQSEFDTVLAQYEHLQRGAIPRRLLSEAEDRIIKLERELNRLKGIEPTVSAPTPAPAKRREPAPQPAPAPVVQAVAEPIVQAPAEPLPAPETETVAQPEQATAATESEAQVEPETEVEAAAEAETETELSLQSEPISTTETIKPKGKTKSTRRRR